MRLENVMQSGGNLGRKKKKLQPNDLTIHKGSETEVPKGGCGQNPKSGRKKKLGEQKCEASQSQLQLQH